MVIRVPHVLRFAMAAMVAGVSAFSAAAALAVFAPHAMPGRSEPALAMALSAPSTGPGAVLKAADGHYWAAGEVNGQTITFLVDTGATAVALTPSDAERLGLRPRELAYSYRVVTAGGQARAAAVTLPSITVAGARLEQVDALVIEKGLETSLLGMTYLGRLARFEATPQALFLQP